MTDASWQILTGGCVDRLRELPDASVDACVTDPPYGLSTEPDVAEVLRHWLAGDDYQHRGGGFMGRSWDSFVPGPAVWRECHRVLKPGGHLLAFFGSRTVDLGGIAIRLAGFEIRDSLMWIYGCLTPDVEVLTAAGWKRGIDVEVGEHVAQWDTATEAITLAAVERAYRAPYSGPMRVLRNHDTDQLLTPNHRVVHEHQRRQMTAGVRRSWWENTWTVAEAEHVARSGRVRLPLAGYADGPGITGGEDYAALLGWAWTEGHFDRTGTGVRIYQSPSANPQKTAQIDALMNRVAPAHKRYDRERDYKSRRPGVGTVRVTEATWFFSGELARRVRADMPCKRPAVNVLWRMTLAERRAFLDAALLGDGSQGDAGSWHFYAKYREDLDLFQIALALTGQRGRITMRANREGGHVAVTPRPTTELQVGKLRRPDEHYEGDVWCIGVPTGAFVARRGGQVFVTGNSGFPKSLDVSKAIDGQDARVQRFERAREFQAWLREYVTPQQVNEATGTDMGHHLTTHPTQPAVATAAMFDLLRPLLPAVPERIEELVRIRTVESENMKARAVVGERSGSTMPGFAKIANGEPTSWQETVAHTTEAQEWEGWGTALKPAHEPVVVARKPLVGTVAGNVLEFGTGALNVDGCRIAASAADVEEQRQRTGGVMGADDGRAIYGAGRRAPAGNEAGRWPANVLLSHDERCVQVGTRRVRASMGRRGSAESADVGAEQGMFGIRATGEEVGYADADGLEEVPAWSCVEGCPVAELDAQSGTLTSGANPTRRGSDKFLTAYSEFEGQRDCVPARGVDSGGASRFFYVAKASSAERNAGLDGFEEREPTERHAMSGLPDLRMDREQERRAARNFHPTVKALDVMRWLVRLVTPPGGLVLDPFAGSGTTGCAAVLEGFRFLGVEREAEYVPIAEARVAWWSQWPVGLSTAECLRLDAQRRGVEVDAEERRREREGAGQLDILSLLEGEDAA